MNENELLEKKEIRESVIGRTEVLDKTGELLLLSNTEYATKNQVAEYYKVSIDAIESIERRNKDELITDGYKNYSNKEIKSLICQNDGFKIPNRGMNLFPKRAILRIGMLLRDSEIAKEIRTRLLDIVQDIEKANPEIIHNVVNEISEEKQLMLDRVEAEMNGDYNKVSLVNSQLFALKNKRIKELEDINKNISTHALNIIESRAVINRLVRNIAMKEYNSMFGKAWGELYSKMNYILHINIKARTKKKGKSYLDTLTDNETFEVEKIVRNWAVELGLDVDKLLKIA